MLNAVEVGSSAALPELDPHANITHVYDSDFRENENIYSTHIRLINDRDILNVSQKIAEAFPEIPLLGVDILKNEMTGKLYGLEINSGGNTWHFSSPIAKRPSYTRDITIEDRKRQFGAWDIAASALIEKTIYYAK